MQQEELIEQLNIFLTENDPSHSLLLLGIGKASDWVNELKWRERKLIFDYFEEKLSLDGDLPVKDRIIKILGQISGEDSIEMLDKVVLHGENKLGKYIVQDAINTRLKIKNFRP